MRPLYQYSLGLLICTLISENQGLEKSRSVSNLRKKIWSCKPGFFLVCHLDFFQVYSSFFFRYRPRKKSRFAGPEIFLRFESDLDFSRPCFSEIRVQIKRPTVQAWPISILHGLANNYHQSSSLKKTGLIFQSIRHKLTR